MKRILLSLLCLCAFLSVRAEAWTPETLPSPKEQGQDYYVSNPDGVLNQETVDRLNAGIVRLNRETGVELAVVAIDQMGGDQSDMPHNYALHVFNNWGIGDKVKNTGVLVFLARSSRDIQIITGDGIAGILTDRACGEILDDNLRYLKKGDFDEGMIHICQDIANLLMTNRSRAELVLGWKPADPGKHTGLRIYLAIGFILMGLLGYWGYRKMQGRPGMRKEERKEQAWPVQLVAGLLMFIFPLPILLFYIFYRILSKHLKDVPPLCSKCGIDKVLLSPEEGKTHLSPAQLFDEKIDSYRYEVWRCPDCGEIEFIPVKGKYYYKYDLCPQCGANAMETTERKVLVKAAKYEDGKQENTRVCQCCGYKDSIILRLKKADVEYTGPDDDYDWSSSSSSGSSRSSGSSGSWGGGRSSGGGAGRKF